MGNLIRLPVWSFSPSTHDARCYSSHCVCSHNICHKCSLCNRNSQSGLPRSCAPPPHLPHSKYSCISTKYMFLLLASALTFLFSLASYDSHVLFKKKCMSGAQDSSLIFASFSQHLCNPEIIAWLLIYTLCVQCCLSSPSLKCLLFIYWLIDWFTSMYATDFFLPLAFPLSHRFQLYLQTTWLVTSMLRRCRTLTLNGMCPLVVSPSTVHTHLLFQWLEIAWPQLKKTLNCCFNEYFSLVCGFASGVVYFPL